MKMMRMTKVPIVIITLMLAHSSRSQNVSTEANENSVEVKFYRLQVSEWVSGLMESTFHALLASEANTYCRANLATCGLVVLQSDFKDAHIGKLDNSPVDDDKDMLYQFYIEYPQNSNKTASSSSQTVLSKSTVKSIVLQLRTNVDYISELGCDKCYITYIDDDFYGIPPSSLENKVIIPIAFLILAILIIVTIALREWDKKKEKDRKFMKQNMPKKKKEPEYVVPGDVPKKTKLPDEKMPQDNIRKKIMYEGSSSTSPKRQFNQTGGASNDSGLDLDGAEKVLMKHHSLQPLEQGEQELKRRKKKKEKKRSKRSTKVDGIENQGYGADDEGQEKHEMKTEL